MSDKKYYVGLIKLVGKFMRTVGEFETLEQVASAIDMDIHDVSYNLNKPIAYKNLFIAEIGIEKHDYYMGRFVKTMAIYDRDGNISKRHGTGNLTTGFTIHELAKLDYEGCIAVDITPLKIKHSLPAQGTNHRCIAHDCGKGRNIDVNDFALDEGEFGDVCVECKRRGLSKEKFDKIVIRKFAPYNIDVTGDDIPNNWYKKYRDNFCVDSSLPVYSRGQLLQTNVRVCHPNGSGLFKTLKQARAHIMKRDSSMVVWQHNRFVRECSVVEFTLDYGDLIK